MKEQFILKRLLYEKERQKMDRRSFATPYERIIWLSEAYESSQIDALECELHLADMEQVADDWRTGLETIRIPPNLFPELKDQFMNTYTALDYLKRSIIEFRQFLEEENSTFNESALKYAREAQYHFEEALESAHDLLSTLPAA